MAFSDLKNSLLGRIKQIFVVAGPYSFAMLLIALMEALNALYAGQIGTVELQAIGISMALLNALGFAVSVGITYGYEVLGP